MGSSTRQSTWTTPTPSATWTMCPSRRASGACGEPSRIVSASAGTTAASWSARFSEPDAPARAKTRPLLARRARKTDPKNNTMNAPLSPCCGAEPVTLSQNEVARYSRHLIMPEVGMEGQKRLKAASVLLIGAGGLGSPLGLYLAAAGIGRIGLVDFDVVDFSNLQRQVL